MEKKHSPLPSVLPEEPRRGFFAQTAAIVIGGLVTVFPFLSGLLVFSDPLRRQSSKAKFIRVATLDSVPDDGVPRQFPVIFESRDDAWTRFLNQPGGAVYLVRSKGTERVEAFNATCPHAGCFIAYVAAKKHFGCPCHKSSFDLSGARTTADSPSPRDMDSLECEVRNQEIWVKFQNFRIATEEKIPVA